MPVTKKKKLCSEVQIWFGREHVPIFLVQVSICQYSTKFTFEVSSLYIAPEESRFQCNASLIMPMNYCPCNDWGSNSAAAAALKLFRSVIKSWISYGASLKWAPTLPWYPSCSLYIIALCIEHSFYQASIHNLISNLPQATLNWMAHFKIMFHHTINNGEYLPEKLEKPLCWKWPLTPVMTCLI